MFAPPPPKPRYEFIWDTELVLNFLKNLNPPAVTLKLLTLKTVTLLTLLSGQRVSTIHQFQLSQMQRTPNIVIFNIQGLMKHSRSTKRDLPITYHVSLMMLLYVQWLFGFVYKRKGKLGECCTP